MQHLVSEKLSGEKPTSRYPGTLIGWNSSAESSFVGDVEVYDPDREGPYCIVHMAIHMENTIP
jgi:hypothetical protein